MRPVKIGLLGLGTVGGGLVKILKEHHDDFVKHQGVDIQLVACSSRKRQSAIDLGVEDVFVETCEEVINNPEVDIVVELIGGTGVADRKSVV